MRKLTGFVIILLALFISSGFAGVKSEKLVKKDAEFYRLSNGNVAVTFVIKKDKSFYEILEGKELKTVSSGDFGLNFVWTDWRAPGKPNNGEVEITFTKRDFTVTSVTFKEQSMVVAMSHKKTSLKGRLIYTLEDGKNYFRREVSVKDSLYDKHYLEDIVQYKGRLSAKGKVIKKGAFGQPVAIEGNNWGIYAGLEFPASVNRVKRDVHGKLVIECSQKIGEKINSEWLKSEAVVIGVTPDSRVKHWFMKYVDDIRVADLKPYTLYNSWYDLRAIDYPSRKPTAPGNIMNHENVMRMINLVKKHIVDKHGIKMDAFVLDDGWDVYKSDWALRKKQFPHGMKPIADKLEEMGTDLGIWFGPTGGYSARMQRINWMKENGYEVVGQEKKWHNAMLCLGGKKYSALFKKRATDFVKNDNVKYFKWDGIQFSCSETDHGHPIGIHSRRAILKTLFDISSAVRKANKDVYLNITSGTWLSPWWVKYSNQIWMDGEDYQHANVPSISKRDSAITYRDFVLYDDFRNKDLWFPVSNLMTHGIIKGHLQKLGGESEPIDKFTDNALLYFARGVAMWELYISPDMLTEAEWYAMGQSMKWARENFDVLVNGEMVGGDPVKRETYGYVHFKGKKGVIAARNPYIEKQSLKVKLDPVAGLDKDAYSLVFEKVYPERWVSPELYSAGSEIEIPLEGYETAIFEVYPVSEAKVPLIGGVVFDTVKKGNGIDYKIYRTDSKIRVLNPELAGKITSAGSEMDVRKLKVKAAEGVELVKVDKMQRRKSGSRVRIDGTVTVLNGTDNVRLAVQTNNFTAGKKEPMAGVRIFVDGKLQKSAVSMQKGLWSWHITGLKTGSHKVRVEIDRGKKRWKGRVELWATGMVKQMAETVTVKTRVTPVEKVLPPKPWKDGEFRVNKQLMYFILDK